MPLAFLRPSVLWLNAWFDLVGGVAWTTDVGHAVTMLAGPRKRDHLRQALVAVVVWSLGVAAVVLVGRRAPLAVTVVLGVPAFVVSGGMVLGSLRTLRAVAAMRRRLRPRGSYFLYGLCASATLPERGGA